VIDRKPDPVSAAVAAGENRRSARYCAASHGDADVVQVLLEAGADVELADADTPSETALRAAAAFGWARDRRPSGPRQIRRPSQRQGANGLTGAGPS